MKTNTRGFIPLVAIILLGITAVAGGTIATVSIRHNKKLPETPVTVVAHATTTSSTYSAPVMAKVKSSTVHATSTAKQTQQTPVAQILATLDIQTQKDCQDVSKLGIPSAKSLISGIQIICKRLTTPGPNTIVQVDEWKRLEEDVQQKYTLLLATYRVTGLTWDTSLLKEFVANPSPEAFRVMCGKAISVEVPLANNKKVLSADRTTMVSVPTTLYDVMACGYSLDQYHTIVAIIPGSFQLDFKDGDTNYVREKKISYNEQLKKLLGDYRIAVVENIVIPSIDPSTHHLVMDNESDTNGANFTVYVPEDIANQLIKNPADFNISHLVLRQGQFLVRGTLKK